MISLKSIRMTQIIGTPRNIPIKPKKCPKTLNSRELDEMIALAKEKKDRKSVV